MQTTTTAVTRGAIRRHGYGFVRARAEAGRTVVSELRATSPLRFVRPTFPGSRAASLCLVTLGGGLVDGDAIDAELVVERDATLVVFTQSTTKAFRGSSRQSIRARVEGTLVLVPDPVACFADARYEQRIDVALEGAGSVVILDGFTSGRAAFGERWAMSSVDLATTVSHGGQLVVRDALHLAQHDGDGPIAPRMDAFEAIVTVLAYGPRVRAVSDGILGKPVRTSDVVAAPSRLAQDGAALVRIAATSPAHAIAEARRRLRNLPEIDVVDPFASRH